MRYFRNYGQREVNTIGIKAKDQADKVPGSVQLDTFEEITDYVLENAKPGDLVITLGCGDVKIGDVASVEISPLMVNPNVPRIYK